MMDSAEKSHEISNEFEVTPVESEEIPPVLKIANYIKSLQLTPKKFIHMLLTSSEPEIVERRKYWGTSATWESTEQIIEDIRRITVDEKGEEKVWNEYMLSKAQSIAESQNIPIRKGRDKKKNVMFFSSRNIVHDDLSHSRDVDRQKLVEGSMPFMYQLIRQKLRHSDLLRQRRAESKRSKTGCQGNADEDEEEAEAESGDDEEVSKQPQDTETHEVQASRFEDYVYRKSNDKQANQEHRLDQMENGLTFLAGGVSERMNKYLGYIGLSTSRRTATRALRKLGSDTAALIKSRSAQPTPVAPFICCDNLDFEERIHTERLEESTKMFHGSWAYIHFLRPALLANVDPNSFTLNGFRKILLEAGKVDINPGLLISKKEDHDRWRQTLKYQIAKTLLQYLSPGSAMEVMGLSEEALQQDLNLSPEKFIEVGIGTDSDQLILLYSINIPLLRELLHKLKGRSGSNHIYQSHKNLITPASLKSFLRFARLNQLTKNRPGSCITAGAVKDCNRLGIQKLQLYATTNDLGRFRWSDWIDIENPKDKDELDFSEVLEWVSGD
ncbi:uncharacterized protein MELLADRAFT_67805 [Melampsora larici-populina 98AG31]|uniref:Uncharacterized protein n=1 Tax=Melampsora larici-populina (strain 98AG31 / pathotype 3-4-7) TaxID=747676 RepID=F4S4H3_MELLP|nr:uncharacterized protein MELLADRAFT_67805 [Melampsora larici-populina 98AG31]EGG00466.1 hypothetical protein MELLADRAFT_67805 [Melampsora larici-populina 98AG31]